MDVDLKEHEEGWEGQYTRGDEDLGCWWLGGSQQIVTHIKRDQLDHQ